MARTRKIIKNSVHRALNAIGDRWSQLILEEAFRGTTRFEDFRARTGAPRNTLSNRLRGLVANGILERRAHREGAARQAYHLTEMGKGLFDSVLLAWSWGIRWDEVSPHGPAGLAHAGCGRSMLPQMVCEHCGGDISLHSCSHHPGPGAGVEEIQVTRLHRRRQPGGADETVRPTSDVVDMTGDRWTGMVISTQYFGVHRFDDIQAMLDIATNILTDRLRALVANGVFERRLYELSPPRYEYWLTRKGKDLYPHALALLLWADRWLADASGPPVEVTHNACGKPILAQVICSGCRAPLTPDNVAERRPGARTKA
ncbi:MAG: transcriptional regulator [Phenylobacterium sp.]|uniref:winged helix-turn-helix transcriptional regulator n=1 Tax=Phenylobacterium sp. TaxID=1871053 RepID=UPI0012117174|nr:helix-turn-helix domain-containing protein [Phenylobacterium sp.]TAJ70155.1 MAG: transcriptional regulator [Phenylobacterium sp.]